MSPEVEDTHDLFFDSFEPRRANRYLDSVESKQKISGCLFAFLGSIVFAFSVFLMHRGATSRRSEEIEDYSRFVNEWTT